MIKNAVFRAFICSSLLSLPLISSAQKVIDFPPKIVVICKDGDDRKCMAGVKVVFRKGDTLVKTINTDACGRCLILNPKAGDYFISATKPGFFQFTLSHVDIPANQTVVLEIPMDANPNAPKAKNGRVLVAEAAGARIESN